MSLFGIVWLSLLASYLVGCFLDPIAAFFCLWFNHFPVSKRLGNLFVQFEFCFGSSCNPDLCRDTLLVSHRHRMYSDFADHFDILHALKLKHYSQDWRVNVDIVSIPISSTNLQQLLWFVHTHTHIFSHLWCHFQKCKQQTQINHKKRRKKPCRGTASTSTRLAGLVWHALNLYNQHMTWTRFEGKSKNALAHCFDFSIWTWEFGRSRICLTLYIV